VLKLVITKRTDVRLLERMINHYSKPKGFVGRNICYAVTFNNDYYGHIVGGSASLHLPGRDEYINQENLNQVVNNVFYSVSKVNNQYPTRNFTTLVIKKFMGCITKDWFLKYGDNVVGFETLVEPPRTGDLYKKAGWVLVGTTKGFTCKRQAGTGTDGWSGKRVWDTVNLRPKLVFCFKNKRKINEVE